LIISLPFAIKQLEEKMKYIVVKQIKRYEQIPELNGTWFVVRLKNTIAHLIMSCIVPEFDYYPFRDKKEAIRCAEFLSKGKSKYDCETFNKGAVYETK